MRDVAQAHHDRLFCCGLDCGLDWIRSGTPSSHRLPVGGHMIEKSDKEAFLVGAAITAMLILLIAGIASCSSPATCQQCVERCRPIELKSCNIDKREGEWRRPTCECVDELRDAK